MESNNELNNLTCQIKEHSNLKIIGFCIDQNCNANNKFACQECFFDIHSGHKLMKITKLNSIIQNKLKDYKIENKENVKEFYYIFNNNMMYLNEKYGISLPTEVLRKKQKEDISNDYLKVEIESYI